MYVARARPCTQSVHGRERSCTRAVNTAIYTAVYTVTDDHVHGPCTAVYTVCTRLYMGHEHGPSVSRTRPCTQPVRGKTWPGTQPVLDRVRTVYMAVHGPCGRLHGRLYGPCARPCTYHVHGRAWSVHDPNTTVNTVVNPVHGRVYGPYTWPCTVYMHVFVACVYGRSRPCTDCYVRAMYMVRS